MGKVLRIFVYIILVLSMVSMFFANQLYLKRELLMGRNRVLEEQIIKVAKTIEAEDAPDAASPVVMKDTDTVTDRELTTPEKVSVFESYAVKLEQSNLPAIDYDNTAKRIQLRQYFLLDAEGKYILDPVDNKPSTKGKGSMQELMDALFDRAKVQQAALNKTRSELTKMRERFAEAIEEINRLKTDGRTTKIALKVAQEKIVALTSEKEALEAQVAKLTAEKRELNAELADAKNTIEVLTEEKVVLTEELTKNRQAYEELKARFAGKRTRTNNQDDQVAITTLSAGDKGKIIEANDELKFVIIDFSNDAMTEMLGAERQNQLPQLDMNIRRTGRQSATGEFVTRIKLRQAVRGKNLVVADILNDWQQTPVEKGDVVFF